MKESRFIQVHPSTGLSDNSQEVKHRYGHAAGIQTMNYHAARSTLPAWLRKRLDAKTNYQFLPVRGSFLTSKLANEMQWINKIKQHHECPDGNRRLSHDTFPSNADPLSQSRLWTPRCFLHTHCSLRRGYSKMLQDNSKWTIQVGQTAARFGQIRNGLTTSYRRTS